MEMGVTMGTNYYRELLKKASSKDLKALDQYLKGDEISFIQKQLKYTAMTLEFNSWQITLFNNDDLDNIQYTLKNVLTGRENYRHLSSNNKIAAPL